MKLMLPYFFAAGHVNYVCYGLNYLTVVNGEFAVHSLEVFHAEGTCNATLSKHVALMCSLYI